MKQTRKKYQVRTGVLPTCGILPYRAGYEEKDRQAIQRALSKGDLAGVVSTSALELGLDIGEIDIVVMLGMPPSIKAFRQRLGRAGRRNEGWCVLVDDRGVVDGSFDSLAQYMDRTPEPGWLYLDNEYIQYSHALCAAVEYGERENTYDSSVFESLPNTFRHLLQNEFDPTETIPDELYPLKQRAQSGPHYEFPLRVGIEKSFDVREQRGPIDIRLGTLSYSQALREAYPGAIYYYMARPYRVATFKYRTGEIRANKTRRWTTKPVIQNMVFPKFPGGILKLGRSTDGFVAEAEIQVNERVTGFVENRGTNKIKNDYGTGSKYSQRPISRFFETTGVCWYFLDKNIVSEQVAHWLLTAFCTLCGVQPRDIGVGMFHVNPSNIWDTKCQGMCIYDSVHGSLRLTRQLADCFREAVDLALDIYQRQPETESSLINSLYTLREYIVNISITDAGVAPEDRQDVGSDWVSVIVPGEVGMYLGDGENEEVRVLDWRYTPRGLMYELESRRQGVKWMVAATGVTPIHGRTQIQETNLVTGETKE